MNSGDQAGSVMATLVWLLMIYSAVTVTLLTTTEGIPPILGMIYCVLVCMSLASHAKTSLTDPGAVPKSAVPMESQRRDATSHSMCGQCQSYKPPAPFKTHHCRICNRCISGRYRILIYLAVHTNVISVFFIATFKKEWTTIAPG